MSKKAKIVIADDDVGIRTTLIDILTEKNYAIDAVQDGYELLANLKKKSPQIIILDLMMPEKDGIEVLSTIKSISPNTKIIIYTGFKKYENSIYARSADRFLLKGETPEKLLQTIEELLEK